LSRGFVTVALVGAIALPSRRHGQGFGPNLTKRLAIQVGSGMAISASMRVPTNI
jgi:hypothetical protein